MSIKSNLLKAAGLGIVVTALGAGAAFAAVATSSVNVRTGPGTGYGVIDTLRPGEFVDITGTAGGWCEVSKSGPDGWVSCAYLSGDRMNTYDRYDDRYGDRGPSVNLSFGFGTPYQTHRSHPRPMYQPYRWW